ncbi:hypothetical protein Pcinc_040058 [Petrolisthes cinctipes]|uniref:Uncharacterized protein n=1 Tax=Petrolisthes cinctipes TaxID=88211 RepID=A0AAE1BMB9_PETCI|nr:hypothetical protein Pcinc_040058 [Petrolisthes cinctipes]
MHEPKRGLLLSLAAHSGVHYRCQCDVSLLKHMQTLPLLSGVKMKQILTVTVTSASTTLVSQQQQFSFLTTIVRFRGSCFPDVWKKITPFYTLLEGGADGI